MENEKKRKFEASESNSETEEDSDSTWQPSSEEEESDRSETVAVKHTRSRGVAQQVEGADVAMDQADEVINNESDFSSESEDEEDEEDDEEEGEEEEEVCYLFIFLGHATDDRVIAGGRGGH